MPLFLCRAVATMGTLEKPHAKTEMEAEHDLFEAIGADLASQARRQRLARLTAPFTATWARIIDRLTRRGREAQAHSDLLERLENMPAYMLKDIGVTRDTVGRYCHYNDYGMLVELAPEGKEPAQVTDGQTSQNPNFGSAYAAQ